MKMKMEVRNVKKDVAVLYRKINEVRVKVMLIDHLKEVEGEGEVELHMK